VVGNGQRNSLEMTALSLGERVDRGGAFTSRRGPGEGSVSRGRGLRQRTTDPDNELLQWLIGFGVVALIVCRRIAFCFSLCCGVRIRSICRRADLRIAVAFVRA
jgi:hypothetical protein